MRVGVFQRDWSLSTYVGNLNALTNTEACETPIKVLLRRTGTSTYPPAPDNFLDESNLAPAGLTAT